jgi:hypothetical protein
MTRSGTAGPGQLAAPGTPRWTNCTCSSPPVVHGRGKRLLAEPGDKVPLKLGDPAAFQTGVLTLTYARA